jgi:hypothetical protein
VSDSGLDDIFIFRLPTLKLVGKLTGFDEPQGECTDNSGDVWVANTRQSQVLEYSHTGALEGSLMDPTSYPEGCAWDPQTGNLAVTGIAGRGSNASPAIEIYNDAGGIPTPYRNPNQAQYDFAGYDPNGNLFVDGKDAGGNFMLSELPKGAMEAHTVQITGGTIYGPGMVQWYTAGNDLVIGDESCGGESVACVYRVSIKHSSGSITGKTKLDNYIGKHACHLVQGYLYGAQLLGGDVDTCGLPEPTMYAWPFPKGGKPTAYNNSVLNSPIGAVVSK